MKKSTKRFFTIFPLLFGLIFGALLSVIIPSASVHADEWITVTPIPLNPDAPTEGNEPTETPPANEEETPEETDTPDDQDNPQESEDSNNTSSTTDACKDQTGALYWIVCPTTGLIASMSDNLYAAISDLLNISPIAMDSSSPIYVVWQYARNITNIVFVIFLLIVIYSQLTGVGLNNYGVKRILPRLIITVVLVNLSFIVCALGVDISNIIGNGLRGTLDGIQEQVILNSAATDTDLSLSTILGAVLSGGSIAGVAIGAIGGAGYVFFTLLVVLFGAIIAIIAGLITIAARQAVVALLIMIAPLAFVAYLLPNTEKWFDKWKNLLFRMLIFYPAFSFLFGASQLLGYALITSAQNDLGVILGVAVQFFPLFGSWPLMKMSGTVLNSLNTGIRRLASPIQKAAAGWSLSKAEEARQEYLANSYDSGARLRRYLDYRRELRELNTRNAVGIRRNKAIESSLIKASASTGRDENGLLTWDPEGNRYVRNAKLASLYDTRAKTAGTLHQNTLSSYGDTFGGQDASSISDAHATAFEEAMVQQFLTINNAEADQKWLLGRYLKASANRDKNPYEFNRLVKSAAGALHNTGESSIMGQVIINNANIEKRRRQEWQILQNKFGLEKHKTQFRSMMLDMADSNDDGYELDEHGTVIEDKEYRLLPGYWQHSTSSQQLSQREYDNLSPAEQSEYYKVDYVHREYPYYFWKHKTTDQTIENDEYQALTPAEQEEYRKVRYFNFTDDKNNVVNRIDEDDAAIIKEITTTDIAIADPINRRYAISMGVDRSGQHKDGTLRPLHGTIRTALDSSGFNGHNAAYSAMFTSAMNAGYINTMADYYYLILQGLGVATKPGNFHKQDAWAFEEDTRLVQAADDPTLFDQMFREIANTVNNNGNPLKGARMITDENGNSSWQKIELEELATMSDADVLEARKNFVKHIQMPKTFKTIAGNLGRKMSPEALASLKPGAAPAMLELLNTLLALNYKNLDSSIPFEDRIDGGTDLFSTPDGDSIYRQVVEAKQDLEKHCRETANGRLEYDKNYINPEYAAKHTSKRDSVNNFADQLAREAEARRQYNERNDIQHLTDLVEEYASNAHETQTIEELTNALQDLFANTECLMGYQDICQDLINQYATPPRANYNNFIDQITDSYNDYVKDQIDDLRNAAIDFITGITPDQA